MKKRIIFDLVLLCTIFYAPWWVVVALAFGGAFLFPLFYEIIACGVLFDLLYGAHLSAFQGTLGLMSAIVIFFVARYAKKITR